MNMLYKSVFNAFHCKSQINYLYSFNSLARQGLDLINEKLFHPIHSFARVS